MAGLQTWDADLAPRGPHRRHCAASPSPTSGISASRSATSSPPGAPDPLRDAEDDDVEFLDADERSWGGPHYVELEKYVATLGDDFDLARAFEGGSRDVRRPVDLLGLLEIAHRNGMTEGDDVSIVEALRPDGTSPPLRLRGRHRPHHEGSTRMTDEVQIDDAMADEVTGFIAPVAMENDLGELFAGDRGVLDHDIRRVLVRLLQRRFLLKDRSRDDWKVLLEQPAGHRVAPQRPVRAP
jgi:hypothetical protein